MQQNEILKNLRVESGLKQKELADKLGIGQSTIVGYEKGLHEATAEILSRYANFFNVSMDYLTGLTDEIGSVIKPKPSPTAPTLSLDEQQLLNAYRTMRSDLRPTLLSAAKTLAQTPAEIAGNTQKKKA